MKLYEVRNGYTGNGPCHVLVIAESELAAVAQAALVLRERPEAKRSIDFWNPGRFETILLADNTSVTWASEVRD